LLFFRNVRIFFGIFGGLGFELFMLQTKLGDALLHLHTRLKCHISSVLFSWVLKLGGVGTIYVTMSQEIPWMVLLRLPAT